jgi:SAM-dependent methyltransferase/uncharacterized protein YbaR (Trm112 family)
VRESFARDLRCPDCSGPLSLEVRQQDGDSIREGLVRCACGRLFPVIAGVPRLLPADASRLLQEEFPAFFRANPELAAHQDDAHRSSARGRTRRAFGEEWNRFPAVLAEHERIFRWYFEGPESIGWEGRRVLDAGCGMGRWLHFARQRGSRAVGMDVSVAVDVAAAREGDGADFVQADLCRPPFAEASFDLVYCLGVLHHLEDPLAGVRALARLVRPGGELRLYVYRMLDDEPAWKRRLFAAVTLLRSVSTRLPYTLVHALAWLIAVGATTLFLWPRRLLRRFQPGDRLTRGLPLAHYTDVPFGMLVSEQFDRLVAPIEGRYRREDVAGWLEAAGFEIVAILPELGWRAIGRRPH